MEPIFGKWIQPAGQPFAGLWFEFNQDGTFTACLPEMGIESSGTYLAEDGLIDIDQTNHTLGLIGQYTGRYSVEGDTLIMNLCDPGGQRPDDLTGKNRRVYQKVR